MLQKGIKLFLIIFAFAIISGFILANSLNKKTQEFFEKQKSITQNNQCEQYKKFMAQKSSYNFGSLTMIRPDDVML